MTLVCRSLPVGLHLSRMMIGTDILISIAQEVGRLRSGNGLECFESL